jgi:hypothetical protein
MPNETALPRLIGTTALLIALLALALPAAALAAEEEEGGGPLPAGPALVISPLAFPKTTVQTESATQAVDVVNLGLGEALIETVSLEGPDNGAFKVTGNGCNKLFPGEHCTVWVSFLPNETGEKQATLALQMSNAPTATLSLAAVGVPAELEFTPASHDFGIVRVNETASTGLQIQNSGEGIAQIGNLSIGGPDSGYFWTGNSTCWSHPLAPGESCFAEANFNPREARGYEAEFQASANGSNFAAPLTGTGGSAALEPDANPVELGQTTVGSSGDVRTILLTNNGNIAGGYFIVVIAGGDSGSFQLLEENCSAAPVAPEATCTAQVRFRPQSPGPKQARLALFGDSEGGTMIFLSGEGLAPAATLSPGFDFGTEAAGSRGAAHTFTLSNDGAAPLELAGVSLTGADPDQFVLSGDGCTDAVLAAGEKCAVRVRFAPDSAGAKAARLRIGSTAGSFGANLAGAGIAPQATSIASSSGGAAAAAPASPLTSRHQRKARLFKRGSSLIATKAMRRR